MITEFYKINTIENKKFTLLYGNNSEFMDYATSSVFEHANKPKIYEEEEFITQYQHILSPGLFDSFFYTHTDTDSSNIDSDIKTIIIPEVSEKYLSTYQKILLQQNDNQNCVLYMFSTKLRSTSKMVQFFNKDSSVFAIKCYDISYDLKEKIIKNECNMQKVNPITPLIKLLQKTSLNQMVEEIKKASIFYQISEKALKEYIETAYYNDNTDFSINTNFVYEFASGNISVIENIISAEPIYIIRSLISHFINLLEGVEMLNSNEGKTPESISKELGIFFKNEKIFQDQIKRYNAKKIGEILNALNEMELQAKRSYNVSRERDFTTLLLNIQKFYKNF